MKICDTMNRVHTPKRRSGFTLIELIIVVAIIAIIVAAVFVAMDPIRRLNSARNVRRRTDTTAIAKATELFRADGGDLSTIPNDNRWRMIGTAATGCSHPCGTPYALFIPQGEGLAYVSAEMPQLSMYQGGAFTVSVWIKIVPPPSNTGNVSVFASSSDGTILGVLGANYMFNVTHVGEVIISALTSGSSRISRDGTASNFQVGQFNHLVLTYNGGGTMAGFKIYVNGQQVTLDSSSASIASPATSIYPKSPTFFACGIGVIGAIIGLPGPVVDCTGDDARIYNADLSTDPTLIAALADSDPNNDPVANLAGYWKFDEGMDLTAYNELAAAPLDISDPGVSSVSWVHQTAVGQTNVAPPYVNELALMDQCVDVAPDIVAGRLLTKLPINPSAGSISPDAAKTHYAVKRNGPTITVRSCLMQGEGPGGIGRGPLIEAVR